MYSSKSNNKRQLQNVNDAVEIWLDSDVQTTKLNLGFALYGKSYTLFDTNQFGIGAPVIGAGKPGKVNLLCVILI